MDSRMGQEISLADMVASCRGAGITYLVLDTCRAKTITRNVPMSKIGSTTCERFCGVDYGADRHNLGVS